jgi:Fusaric acid resistance protein-like
VLDQEKYFLSMAFAALFVGLSDPGGEYGYRVPRMAMVGVLGALLTALGFAIGDRAWGAVVLAAFVVTVLAGLAVKYGLHRFTAGMLLNIWFLIALALPAAYRLDHVHAGAWAQALAWLIGSALTIAYTGILWLARGRIAQAQPGADVLPGDITPVKLTRPVILFVLIRAIAVSAAVAIAFGLHVPNADWMPVATLVAMKPSLQQSALVAGQRLAGAIIGAAVAALFLLAVDGKSGLEVVIVILGALAGSIRAVNYALYCAAVAAAVLIGMGLPHPSNLADEGRRILFTFVGVGIAVLVMFLADLLQKRSGKAATQAVAHPAPAA